jgi:hypothetical protein
LVSTTQTERFCDPISLLLTYTEASNWTAEITWKASIYGKRFGSWLNCDIYMTHTIENFQPTRLTGITELTLTYAFSRMDGIFSNFVKHLINMKMSQRTLINLINKCIHMFCVSFGFLTCVRFCLHVCTCACT